MPWVPELFSAPVLQKVLERRRRDELVSMPFFDGLLAGDLDALRDSFAGEPQLCDPVRGRVRGMRAFEDYVADMTGWLRQHDASVEDVGHVILESTGFEEVVLHLDADGGRVELPVAIVADHPSEGRIDELRLYYSGWPLNGHHATRPPLLSRDPGLRLPDIVADYQRALAAGDVDAIVATFEAEGSAREPAGGEHVHRGSRRLRDFYEWLFCNEGGVAVEHCAIIDDGRTCALEYNTLRWGETPVPPQAGVATYVRGQTGLLASVRAYDDVDPPVPPQA